jgi:hypothetical protein
MDLPRLPVAADPGGPVAPEEFEVDNSGQHLHIKAQTLRLYNISPKSARMEQSFCADGGKNWEVNWICELSR